MAWDGRRQTMDTRKKNILLAAVIGLFAISLYVLAIFKVILSKSAS
jgi:hypothetical protein